MRGLSYEIKMLVQKARESALLAVETYNRPTATFRSGAYVVLMVIAWTSLFHAIFIKRKIKPFYKKKDSKRYFKIDGEIKRWELKECLDNYYGNSNSALRNNLDFFIGLRNKIEHCSLAELDSAIFGECQAMLLNFESMLVSEFGERYAIRAGLSFALQFAKTLHKSSSMNAAKSQQKLFKNVKHYVDSFRSSLSGEMQNSLEYSFKVYLVPKIGNHASNDAIAVEWVKYDPSKPDEMQKYEKVVAMIKPKGISVANLGFFKPGKIIAEVSQKINRKFSHNDHAKCYYHFNVRPSKGSPDPSACDARYCQYDSVHKDYCYTAEWVNFLVDKLSDVENYNDIVQKGKKIKFNHLVK